MVSPVASRIRTLLISRRVREGGCSAQADFPNISRTPLVGGQWRRGRSWPFELAIVSNTAHPEIPATSTLQPIAVTG